MKYRTRSRVIDAVRWQGQPISDLPLWAQDPSLVSPSGTALYCYTLNGPVRANHGDWLILGTKEVYPCKNDVFERNYELEGIPETTFTHNPVAPSIE